MNFLRGILVTVALLAMSLTASAKTKPQFSDTLSSATLAVYSGKQVCQYKTEDSFFGPLDIWGCKFESHFTCTATVVDKVSEDTFAGLTAGHCFSYALLDKGSKYYVSDSLSDTPVLHEINLVKFESDERYDYAVFEFQSLREYPVIDVLRDGEKLPVIGTPVLNVNFSLGVTKQIVEGKVVSNQIENGGGDACGHECGARFFVSIGIGPGASGSPVVDERAHKIVGLVEAVFPSTQMATLVMPLGVRFADFVDDASAGLKPAQPPNNEQFKIHPSPTLWDVLVRFLRGVN